MRRGDLRLALLAALGAAAPIASAAPQAPPPAPEASFSVPGWRVPPPDGRRLNLRCLGAGVPTVLLESGFAGTSKAWRYVMPPVAARHRVCAYDRAGYGFSTPGPPPRDGAATAKDLSDAVTAARLHGPFVLVGHSAGALSMRLLAAARPADVAGVVLVDPSVEHQDRRFALRFNTALDDTSERRRRLLACLAAAENSASTEPAGCAPSTASASGTAKAGAASPADRWRTKLSELDSLWTTTSEEVEATAGDLEDIPLIVLTADRSFDAAPSPQREALQAFWESLHRELARRSRRGEQRTVSGTSHMMMIDRPEAIVTAIEDVTHAWEQKRSDRRPRGPPEPQ